MPEETVYLGCRIGEYAGGEALGGIVGKDAMPWVEPWLTGYMYLRGLGLETVVLV